MATTGSDPEAPRVEVGQIWAGQGRRLRVDGVDGDTVYVTRLTTKGQRDGRSGRRVPMQLAKFLGGHSPERPPS